MGKDTCHQHILTHPLSDEAAVEILDFLQVFMTDFENRYSGQILRYYEERSRHNLVQNAPWETTPDPPF